MIFITSKPSKQFLLIGVLIMDIIEHNKMYNYLSIFFWMRIGTTI